MIYIGFHLHAYQPPTQIRKTLWRIFAESYDPVIDLVKKCPNMFFSLDIAKSLSERSPPDFIADISNLVAQNKLWPVNTSAYHYLLLPSLFPEKIILRQLDLNFECYRNKFKINKAIPGIFPPELAFSPEMAKIAMKTGAKWLMTDDEPFVYKRLHLPKAQRAPQNWIPTIYKCGIMLRSRFWSNRISQNYSKNGDGLARELVNDQKKWQEELGNNGDSYIIIAIDFETFGHHLNDSIDKFLIPFFDEIKNMEQEIKSVPLDFIFNHFPKIPAAEHLQEGSWSTSQDDLSQQIPFPLWLHPKNEFHKLWRDFIYYSNIVSEGSLNPKLTNLLDKAFYSCTPWQYSLRNKEIASWCLPMFEKIVDLVERLIPPHKISELKKTLQNLKSLLDSKN